MNNIKNRKAFNYIFIGLIIHVMASMFVMDAKSLSFIIAGIGLLFVFINAYSLWKSSVVPFKGGFKSLFYFFIIWLFFIIIHSFFNDEPLKGFSPVNSYEVLAYLTPLIVFLGVQNLSIKTVLKYSFINCIIGIIFLLFYFNRIFTNRPDSGSLEYSEYIKLVNIPGAFLVTSYFLVICFAFVPKLYKRIGFIALGIALITMLYAARRGAVASILVIFLLTAVLYVFFSKKGSKFLKALSIGVIIFTLIILVSDSQSLLSLFSSRLDEDTRSGVENYFYASFKGKTTDLLFGRGLNGTYYCPGFEDPNRNVIETGYLHLILKGGLVYLILYVTLLLSSAYLGFFRSNNMLLKGMGLYIFAHVLYLYPFGLPLFDFNYFTLWICIVYCHSTVWRQKTNIQIHEYLKIGR